MFFEYATTTPGSIATRLLPLSHCSRSCCASSPPVVTTRSSFSLAGRSASRHRGEEARLRRDVERARLVAGADAVRLRALDHLRVHGDRVAIHEREHHVQVHVRALLLQLHGDRRASAASFSNSRCASSSTICGVVRSLMPIRTVPLPTGMTSPPSIAERPKSWMSNSSCSSLWPASGIPELELRVAGTSGGSDRSCRC